MMYGVPSIIVYSYPCPEAARFLARGGEIESLRGNQLHDRGNAIDRHDDDARLVVGGDAAPMRAADVRRHRERAFEAGRREDAFVPQPGHHLLTCRLPSGA